MCCYDNTDEADRVCFHCAYIIEIAELSILHCPLHNDLNIFLFEDTNNDNSDFINMMSKNKLIFLLNNTKVTIICVKTLYDILPRRRSILYENH